MQLKTVLFFGLTLATSAATWMEAYDVKEILLPLMCNVPANVQIVSDDCVKNVIEISAKYVSIISAAGIFLRMITKSPLFKFLTPTLKE